MNLLLAIVLAVPQTTWIVDAHNGPGTNFTDLPPAVAVAAHGDTILVRDNGGFPFYSGFQVSGKALTIRGAGATGSWLFNSTGNGAAISAVPAGTAFCLQGVKIEDLTLTNGTLAVCNSSLRSTTVINGSVLAADCDFYGGSRIDYAGGRSYGLNGISLSSNSNLVAMRSTFRGGSGSGTTCGTGGSGASGLSASDSAIILHSCSVRGGISGSYSIGCTVSELPVGGIVLTRSPMRVAGQSS